MHDFVIMIFLKSNGYDVFTHANSSYSSRYHIIIKLQFHQCRLNFYLVLNKS
jgi:hypothetical protein